MIVSRTEFQQILAGLKGDRMGLVSLSEIDASKIVAYCHTLLPVLVQAGRLYMESAGAIDTPCQAALALALHAADPAMFEFQCHCDKAPAHPCAVPDCRRQAWLEHLRWRAHTPLPRRRRWWSWERP
jgi:hypothetical protein